MSIEKITNRVRKLLQLADHGTEHEAANAAAQAAALMAKYELDEALVRLDEPSKPAEPIQKEARLEPEQKEDIKRVAWKEAIASAVAKDLGVKMYFSPVENSRGRWRYQIRGMGRESAIQAWRYTCAYLWNTVNELADNMHHEEEHGSARAWKSAFRLGCATRIAIRLSEARAIKAEELVLRKAGLQGKESMALTVVEKDRNQVDVEYAAFSKNWSKGSIGAVGSISSGDGYAAGNQAGDRVSLGNARAGLAAGQGRLTR